MPSQIALSQPRSTMQSASVRATIGARARRMPVRRSLKLTSARNRTYPGYPRGYRPSDLGAISSTAP